MTTFTDRFTTWTLAAKAEVPPPDAHDGIGFSNPLYEEFGPASPGAVFLRSIAEAVAEAITWEVENEGLVLGDADDDTLRETVYEAVNAALPIYSADIWRTWHDLALWAQLTEVADTFGSGGGWLLGLETGDTDRLALLGLLMVAERLGESIMGDMIEAAAE